MSAPVDAPPSQQAPVDPSRWRRVRGPLAVGALGLVATAYVGLVDPNAPGHYPLCPTKYLTGVDCPMGQECRAQSCAPPPPACTSSGSCRMTAPRRCSARATSG